MQRKIRFRNPQYFNSYIFGFKLLLLITACIAFVNCKQQNSAQIIGVQSPNQTAQNAVNINTADIETLENLPHIGAETAKNIVEFREKYGKFRRAENLILVHGMSDKKFRDMKDLIKVE